MSVKGNGTFNSFIAGVDLSAAQFRIARITGNRTVGLSTAANNDSIGITQDRVPQGQPMNVQSEGHSKVFYGATVTAGQPLTSDANGRAIPATTGRQIVGRAIIGGAANDLGEILLGGSYTLA